jgi:hypothetical protein
MCACGKKKTDAVTSVQGANAIVAAGVDMPADEIRRINEVREKRSVNNAAANASS